MQIERRAINDIMDELIAQREALVDPARGQDDPVDWMRRNFEAQMSELRFGSNGRAMMRQVLNGVVDMGIQVAIGQMENIGFGFDWTLANAAAREWAERYVGQLITQIDDTTRRTTRERVAGWIDTGGTLDDLIAELDLVFGRPRAELIASTEVTRAYAEANRIAYRESGVVEKRQWRTANDERVCPICGPLGTDEVVAGLDEPFVHPGTGATYDSPPSHPRCRCWIVPVIMEPANA